MQGARVINHSDIENGLLLPTINRYTYPQFNTTKVQKIFEKTK
nr:MAG TPA: hypothetical protein [Caudoviricetes sp.]